MPLPDVAATPLAAATREALGPHGPLAAADPGFVEREVQQQLAEAVAQALEDRATLVAEAGTGVGKTFAYLVPLLLAGRRALVSTATKSLQDQLFLRDLPRLRDALRVPVRLALLKGRASYLCRLRLQQARETAQLPDRFAVRALARVEQWAVATKTGDLAEVSGLDERSPVIPLVTSSRDNCLGQECPEYRSCHVMQARREAMAAQVARAPLQQRQVRRRAQGLDQPRQIAQEELVLQALGGGGHQRAPPRQQQRHQVREGLADAGAGFGDERAPPLQRVGHREREAVLRLARQEAGLGTRERPVGRKGGFDRGQQAHAGSGGSSSVSRRAIWSRSARRRFFRRRSSSSSQPRSVPLRSMRSSRSACSMRSSIRRRCGECRFSSIAAHGGPGPEFIFSACLRAPRQPSA